MLHDSKQPKVPSGKAYVMIHWVDVLSLTKMTTKESKQSAQENECCKEEYYTDEIVNAGQNLRNSCRCEYLNELSCNFVANFIDASISNFVAEKSHIARPASQEVIFQTSHLLSKTLKCPQLQKFLDREYHLDLCNRKKKTQTETELFNFNENNNGREREDQSRRSLLRQETMRVQSVAPCGGQYPETLIKKWAAVVAALKCEKPKLRRVNVPVFRSRDQEDIRTRSDGAGLYESLRQAFEEHKLEEKSTSSGQSAVEAMGQLKLEVEGDNRRRRQLKFQWPPHLKKSNADRS